VSVLLILLLKGIDIAILLASTVNIVVDWVHMPPVKLQFDQSQLVSLCRRLQNPA